MTLEYGIVITGAGLGDLGALRRLENACFGGDAWPLIDLVGVLILPGIVRLKAVADGEMVGFIGGDIHSGEHTGWVATLGVLPGYRRRGIAKRLMLACEEHMGMSKVRLSVRRTNQAAIDLYESMAYRRVDVWPKYYFDGEDALVLEKIRT